MAITKTIQATVKNRTDTAANWTSKNPVLAEGEIIVVQTGAGETRLKIGDGVKTFTQLPYTDEQIYNNVVTSVNGETGDVTITTSDGTPINKVMRCTVTHSENDQTGPYSCDKTFNEIKQAIADGYMPYIFHNYRVYGGESYNVYPYAYWLYTPYNNDYVFFNYTGQFTINDANKISYTPMQIALKRDLPKSLKNPNALTFTGAVTGTYDGSEAVTINIPESGAGNMKKLTFTGAVTGEYDGTTDVNIDIPIATASTAGIIKVGNGLSISDDGTLSVTTATYYTGTADPVNTLGADGDLYLKTEG